MDQHRFQIDLRGIIDLLSNHLYSSPSVYVRELLQNATDAIRARQRDAPDHEGCIEIRVAESDTGRPQIVFTDDGVGLTEEETHRFLATIGASSKREEVAERRSDFIGQFGIGLLSCFVVSDEIAMVTRSSRGGPAVEWRGRADGTYEVRRYENEAPFGTTVHLSCKEGLEHWFDEDKVRELVLHFGALLPFPVNLVTPRGTERLNVDLPPWRRRLEGDALRDASMAFGESILGRGFFDCLPIRCASGDVEGIAYVLPYSPSPTTPASHRVYLKHMLLSERAENLLPRWAFFVTCVLNTNELRPTASRESFYEDDALAGARTALGDALRAYLIELQTTDPRRLELLVALHYRAIKALAAQDDEFLSLFLDVLPFETSLGRMPFGELRKHTTSLRYAPTVDVFRQIAQVAAAQGIAVVNAGYEYDAEILERAAHLGVVTVDRVDAADLADTLADVTAEEQDELSPLLQVATAVLTGFKVRPDGKRFLPEELPVLYVAGDDATFLRTVDQTKESTEGHWTSMLGSIAEVADGDDWARLYINVANPLIRRLARLDDEEAMRLAIQMLYVQSLLLGHHPLTAQEMSLLNVGLLDLIAWGLDQQHSPLN